MKWIYWYLIWKKIEARTVQLLAQSPGKFLYGRYGNTGRLDIHRVLETVFLFLILIFIQKLETQSSGIWKVVDLIKDNYQETAILEVSLFIDTVVITYRRDFFNFEKLWKPQSLEIKTLKMYREQKFDSINAEKYLRIYPFF